MTRGPAVDRPSLERLVETGMLAMESLHPGGLETTRQLAELCNLQQGATVLDVAAGTGETACFLAESYGARVIGIDHSLEMIRHAKEKAGRRGLGVKFQQADAASLPFDDVVFDVAICECTLCLLDKPRVLREMVRVVRPGGRIGIHDLYWKEGAPAGLKRTLQEIEGETPETIDGWRQLFAAAGLGQIKAVDKARVMSQWMQESRRQLGISAQIALAVKIIRRWGLKGLWTVLQSERVFAGNSLGYAIIVGSRV